MLYEIASAKQLWVLHLKDLIRRSLIELPTSITLETLSTTSLVDLVRRLMTGPATWADGSSSKISTEISLIPADHFTGRRYYQVKLFNGGRYLLCQCDVGPELWDVATQRLVWTQPLDPLPYFDTAFTGANIMLAFLPGNECIVFVAIK